MATIRVAGGQTAVLDWAAAHHLDPEAFSARVDINDDGTITLYRYLVDGAGSRVVIESDVCQTCGHGAGEHELATEPVTITPQRPFPIAVAA